MIRTDSVAGEAVSTTMVLDNATIISSYILEGRRVIVSSYGNERWLFVNTPTNQSKGERQVNFIRYPERFRPVLKAVLFRYMTRGRLGMSQPSDRAIVKLAGDLKPFIDYLASLNIARLSDVRAETCQGYVEVCRRHVWASKTGEQRLKASSLGHRLSAVERLHELSQYTDDAMPEPPWPDTSYSHIAKLTGRGTSYRGGKTPLIPDEIFSALFRRAWAVVQAAGGCLRFAR